VRTISADEELWHADLSALPGWVDLVSEYLVRAHRDGAPAALDAFLEAASLTEA
jgi:hypothetical protein